MVEKTWQTHIVASELHSLKLSLEREMTLLRCHMFRCFLRRHVTLATMSVLAHQLLKTTRVEAIIFSQGGAANPDRYIKIVPTHNMKHVLPHCSVC